jgi:hypothetical protein
MPNQLLAFLRMSRIQEGMELTKVNFEADQIVSQMNEYETLMLMMGDLRDRIDLYKVRPPCLSPHTATLASIYLTGWGRE